MRRSELRKQPRSSEVRAWQAKRSKEWRAMFYAQGYTYKKIDGRWGWIKKVPRLTRSRIHSEDQKEVERLRKKILEAMKKCP